MVPRATRSTGHRTVVHPDGDGRGCAGPAGDVIEPVDGGVLVEPHADLLTAPPQAPGQPGRIDQRAPVLVPQAGQVGGGMDLVPHRVGVEVGHLQPVAERLLLGQPEPVDLVGLGGHVEFAGALEPAVDGLVGDGGLDGVEVGPTQSLQEVDLPGEAFDAVAEAVGQAGRTEAAVAPRRRPSAPVGLEEDDVPPGIGGLGQPGRPQTGEAPADHDEVRLGATHQWWGRVRGGGIVEPERDRDGVGDGAGPVHGYRP